MAIIEVKNLSKKYNITHRQGGYIALRDVITDTLKSPLKFLKHKTKRILGRETKEEFWALKDINFKIERGEAVGIIGANGAGKSTLLKILTGITPPTTGQAILRGKVASLLEVGTGFHPELTGRENILLNGAILGMPQKEIALKFDDIVEFSGVGKFLDTPVKYYSSGMYVRLAFSVAAHMEPDILLVDEVLAVGDADFQKKCLGKMDEVTKAAGRTILFVSHNMTAVQNLCKKSILLEHGKIKMFGDTNRVIGEYLSTNFLSQGIDNLKLRKDRKGSGKVKMTSFFVEDHKGNKVSHLETGKFYTFCLGYEAEKLAAISKLEAAISIYLENGTYLIMNHTYYKNQNFINAPKKGVLHCKLTDKLQLNEGIYNISASLNIDGVLEDWINRVGILEVREGDFFGTGVNFKDIPIYVDHDWSISEK